MVHHLLGGHNHSTHAPGTHTPSTHTPSSGGALEGDCSDDSGYFIAQAIASVIIGAIVIFSTFKMHHVPTGGKKEDYARPWIVGVLLFNICLWNMLPLCVMFLLYHIIMPNAFSGAPEMACLQVVNFPFIPIFLFFQGLSILGFYFPEKHRDMVAPTINNDKGLAPNKDGEKTPKVLMIGATSRGLFFIDALRKRKEGAMSADTMLVDFAGARGFLVNNALAAGLISSESEADQLDILEPTRIGKLKLGIPLADESVDKVVVCPYFRQMQPIGDFVTPEKDKAPRMAQMFVEAIRVLKPGGTINVYDAGMNALLAQADLRDLDCQGVEFIDLELKSAAVPWMKQAHYHVMWTKDKDVEKSVSVMIEKEQHSLSRSFVADKAELSPTSEGTPLLNSDGEARPAASGSKISHNMRIAIVCCYQFTVYFLLMLLAAAVYEDTNVPKDIVNNARASNIFSNAANNYPMMAYFTRSILLNTHHAPENFAMAFIRMASFDLLAMVSTLIFTGIFWVPQFALQKGLNEVDMSDGLKSFLGIIISFILGFGIYLYQRYRSKKDVFKLRDLPDDKWKLAK